MGLVRVFLELLNDVSVSVEPLVDNILNYINFRMNAYKTNMHLPLDPFGSYKFDEERDR